MDIPLPRSLMHRNTRHGFTMIELLIVIMTVAILTAVAYPRFARSVSAQAVSAASTVAAADLEAAFSLAARTRRPMVYACDASLRRCRVTDQATGAVRSERLYDRTSGFEVTTLTWAPQNSGQAVVIGSSGLATQGFSIILSHGASTKRVVVLRSGLIRIN